MLSTDEDLRHGYPTALALFFKPIFQLPIETFVDVNISLVHFDKKVVQHSLHIATLLKGSPNPSEASNVQYDFPLFLLFLKQE